MKIMISQPMNGKSYTQIKSERKTLVKSLEENGNEVVETVFDDWSEEKSPVYYLAKSIELMDKAEKIIFMKGWEQARGCRIEYMIAKSYGKEIEIL